VYQPLGKMKNQKVKKRVTLAIKVIFIAVIFVLLFFSANSVLASAIKIEPLHKVLKSVQNIKDLWGHTRNLVNVVVIAALIYVAFMNILRLQINNFAIKKILPTLILAIILANFSYFICRILIDFANVLIDLLMNGVQGSTGASGTVNSSSVGVAGAFDFTNNTKFPIDPNNLNRSFIFILAEFVGGVMILILAFLFFLRNYVIYFLIVLGPLAFMSLVLPQTKKLFDQWWSQMLKWIYLPVISIFWLWLGGMWYSSGFTSSGGSVESSRTGDLNSAVLALAFAGVCYYLAITTPFKVGGAIMGKYADLGKKGKDLSYRFGTDRLADASAYSLRKSKMSDGTAKKFWQGMANATSSVNPETWKGGIKARMEANASQRKKAIGKSNLYNRLAGPVAQVEFHREDLAGDMEWYSHQQIIDSLSGQDRNGRYRGLDAILDAQTRGQIKSRRLSNLVQDIIGNNNTPGQRREALARRILGMNTQEVIDYFNGSGIDAGSEIGNLSTSIGQGHLVGALRSANKTMKQRGGQFIQNALFATSGVGTDGPIDPDELAQAATPPPPPPADGGGGQQAPQPPQPSPQTREAAKQVNEEMSAEQHKKIAEGLNGGGVGVLNVTAQDIQAHTQSAGLNIPPSALENFAKAATQSNMQIADEIRGRVNEKNNLAHSEALVSSGIMSQLAETPRAKDRVNDLLQIARDGQAGLGQNNAEGLGNAVAAAQLVNPDSAVLLEGLQRRGETDKLEEHVTRILSTAEKQLDDLSKKNGVVLAEQISDFKQKGAGEWQKQVVAESMKEAPQEAHREVIIQQSAERLASLPDNATNQQLMETLNKGFDAMIASNQELHGALGQLGGEDQIKALKEAQSGLADVLDKSIRAAFPTMNENDRLSGSIQKEAMVKAMTDPQVTQGLAQAFGKSMNKSLETTNQMLSKGAKGAKNMDIRPPATD